MPGPIPLAPLAWTALRLGTMAAVALYAARAGGDKATRADHARVLDDLPEGMVAHPDRSGDAQAMNGHGRSWPRAADLPPAPRRAGSRDRRRRIGPRPLSQGVTAWFPEQPPRR